MSQLRIIYCRQCGWLLRASWMAQELLSTFSEEVSALTLEPGSGGIFEIWAGDECIWSRKADGGFPEISELKRRVRDQVAPERDLGCTDRKAGAS
jgi:selenoprotein W-related protein